MQHGTDLELLEAYRGGRNEAFEELVWQPLDASTVNSVPSAQAAQVREAVRALIGEGRIVLERATELLERTG